ncbi:MAG: uncharacterized protein QOH21_1033 [Acidobacteriota bacterium]|jgi:uncharacterized membrane protein (UPF0127 family)|nr:uncharacterized protein [Acidobacteriota bacterium]
MRIGKVMTVTLATVVSMACANQSSVPAASDSTVEATAPPPAAETGPRVTFPDGFVVHTQLATDDESRAQGLMFRDQLRPGTGMLFFFPTAGDYPFWMKNTLIPLDMIWLDGSRKIVAMHHDVPPCKTADCPSYPPHAVALYVLEVAGGVANEHGLKVGDVLQFAGMENVTPR